MSDESLAAIKDRLHRHASRLMKVVDSMPPREWLRQYDSLVLQFRELNALRTGEHWRDILLRQVMEDESSPPILSGSYGASCRWVSLHGRGGR